jgi:hypothetical protein
MFGLLAALLLLILYPAAWNPNEEHFFLLAYRAVAPATFSEFHAAFDASDARFLPHYIVGSLVALGGYEAAHVIGRVGVALMYAAALTHFFRSVQLSVSDALLTLVVFKLAGEQIMGGEWLFGGVESKTLAYPLIFFAFGFLNEGRRKAAIAFCTAATYMHFIVGGFWASVLLFLQWLRWRDTSSLAKELLMYCLAILPLVYVIAREQLTGTVPHGVPSADFIYSVIRNPHHTSPFLDLHTFWRSWSLGVVTVGCLALLLGTFIRQGERNLVLIAGFVGLVELLLALLISFADRTTHFFGKFYLFRPSSLTLFFIITALSGLIGSNLSLRGQRIKSQLVAVIVIWFAWSQFKVQITTSLYPPAMPEAQELVAAVEAHSKVQDIVLIEPYDEMNPQYLRLHRDIARPTLVSWKFVPSNPQDILRWYSLVQIRRRIFLHGCGSNTALPIRWLITLRPTSMERIRNCGPVVWQKGNVALVQVSNNSR